MRHRALAAVVARARCVAVSAAAGRRRRRTEKQDERRDRPRPRASPTSCSQANERCAEGPARRRASRSSTSCAQRGSSRPRSRRRSTASAATSSSDEGDDRAGRRRSSSVALAQNALDKRAEQVDDLLARADLHPARPLRRGALALIDNWFARRGRTRSPTRYYLKAMILVQQEKFEEAVEPAQHRDRDDRRTPTESWLQLLVAIYSNLKDYANVAATLRAARRICAGDKKSTGCSSPRCRTYLRARPRGARDAAASPTSPTLLERRPRRTPARAAAVRARAPVPVRAGASSTRSASGAIKHRRRFAIGCCRTATSPPRESDTRARAARQGRPSLARRRARTCCSARSTCSSEQLRRRRSTRSRSRSRRRSPSSAAPIHLLIGRRAARRRALRRRRALQFRAPQGDAKTRAAAARATQRTWSSSACGVRRIHRSTLHGQDPPRTPQLLPRARSTDWSTRARHPIAPISPRVRGSASVGRRVEIHNRMNARRRRVALAAALLLLACVAAPLRSARARSEQRAAEHHRWLRSWTERTARRSTAPSGSR